MRKIIYILLLIIYSCGGSGDSDTSTPTIENKAPSAPTLVYPANNLLCIDNSISFKWNAATDEENDILSYQIQVAKNIDFSPIEHTFTLTDLTITISLDKGVIYYYRVKAIDSKNNLSPFSTTFSFYTEGLAVSNYVPFTPNLVKPILNEVILTDSILLEWTASDVDNDSLIFDIFLDTNNPPTTKIGDNINTTTLTTNLNSATSYYWKVIIKDGKGGVTYGQVWNFRTD